METTKEKEKCILVPTDFSEACDNALNHAIELGKFLGIKVYVLHIIDSLSKDFIATEMTKIGKIPTSELQEFKIMEEKLDAYIKTKKCGNLFPIIHEGEIFTGINETADNYNAQLIILGTHGKIGFQKIFGSHALKVIDNSNVPVIVVQNRGFGKGYKNMVFPVSLDDEDRQKAEYAVIIAKVFNSTIHIFPKHEDSPQHKAKLSIVINQISAYFKKYDVQYNVIESNDYGDTWDRQILNYSSSIKADLVLILSNPDKHMMFFDNKEDNIIFNAAQIPIMCINYKNTKISSFWGGYSSLHPNVF